MHVFFQIALETILLPILIRSVTNISLKIGINYNFQFAFYLKVLIQFGTVKYIFIYYIINTINKIELYQSYKLIYPVPFMTSLKAHKISI